MMKWLNGLKSAKKRTGAGNDFTVENCKKVETGYKQKPVFIIRKGL